MADAELNKARRLMKAMFLDTEEDAVSSYMTVSRTARGGTVWEFSDEVWRKEDPVSAPIFIKARDFLGIKPLKYRGPLGPSQWRGRDA